MKKGDRSFTVRLGNNIEYTIDEVHPIENIKTVLGKFYEYTAELNGDKISQERLVKALDSLTFISMDKDGKRLPEKLMVNDKGETRSLFEVLDGLMTPYRTIKSTLERLKKMEMKVCCLLLSGSKMSVMWSSDRTHAIYDYSIVQAQIIGWEILNESFIKENKEDYSFDDMIIKLKKKKNGKEHSYSVKNLFKEVEKHRKRDTDIILYDVYNLLEKYDGGVLNDIKEEHKILYHILEDTCIEKVREKSGT